MRIQGSCFLISPHLLAVDSGLHHSNRAFQKIYTVIKKSLLVTLVDKLYIFISIVSQKGIGLCNSTTACVRETNKNVCCLFLITCESCDVFTCYHAKPYSHQSKYL